ncbi:hypothetical protein QQF45_03545 [Halopseudomonas aestusnigri]|uniref:hypothetical protein n=1 Tax=Halopseudomonas aestusnigri TaxID=857252 RepID=UPI00255542A6|nr:hypothetical protein [Halopseudomonas aestusnigri]MDL2198135.1 hypothetical protein [Halopseudomonas aestusnigri]
MIDKEKPMADEHKDSKDFEQASLEQAEYLEVGLFGGEQSKGEKTTDVMASFVDSCSARGEQSLDQWLSDEFRKYPHLWSSEEELLSTSKQVIAATAAFNQSRESLQAHMDKGRSKASWLAGEIEAKAAISGSVHVGQYAGRIDQALADATKNARDMVTTLSGDISQSRNLDGFIAEQHHVDTFNIDAASKGSDYRARVVGSTDLNSVDIEIVNGNGDVVARYQSKYGSDANSTNVLLGRGDYEGQTPLVPEGQSSDVAGSTEVIEADGAASKPLSKEEAKQRQEQAQQEAETQQYDWSDTNRSIIARQIGKQAVIGSCIAVGMQGTRILARRCWNSLNGRNNPSINDDLKEFFESSLRASANTGAQVAVSGALVVAVKNGWLGAALRNTPAGLITNIACVGLQNAKVLYKFGKGELSGEEAIDAIGNTTVTTTMAIAGAAKGAALGSSIGIVFGPVGIAVGGFVGGVAGGIAGGNIGTVVYEAGKSVAKTATRVAASLLEAGGRAVETLGSGMRSLASNLSSFW